jgi:hypothetical protein
MSIEVREERRPKNWIVLIDPFFDPKNTRRGFRAFVTVASQEDFSFEVRDLVWHRAGVSWGSLGMVSADEAQAFSMAISLGAERARAMDIEHGFSKGGTTQDGAAVRDNATEEKKGC